MSDALKKRAAAVRKRLRRAMPGPRTELDFQDAFQLLIATILSAQSTDKMINQITPALFDRYPTAAKLAAAPLPSVERLVKKSGFYRNKAKSIVRASQALVEQHGGEVPRKMAAMVALPGVARKTANLVLTSAYCISSGIVVDRHAARVAQRLGLTEHSQPVGVEEDLCGLYARRSWIDMGQRFVLHGRYICQSRTPRCAPCPLFELCPSAEGSPEGRWTARADRQRRLVDSRGAEG